MRLRLRREPASSKTDNDKDQVAKLFFDAFSNRVSSVEERLRTLGSEVDNLRISKDQSQISDIVLLEKIQRTQDILQESLSWIRHVAESITHRSSRDLVASPLRVEGSPEALREPLASPEPVVGSISMPKVLVHSSESSSLSSITTPTELQVLSLLAEKGPTSAPEIGRAVGRSREHSARLMKKLFEEGFVRRDQTRTPFRYSLVERVRAGFRTGEKAEEGEAVSVPQS